jgi:hypothetical protein
MAFVMTRGLAAFARFLRVGTPDFVALPRLRFNGCCMDESPEELERIRHEAESIDPHKYRRRRRITSLAVAVVFCTAATWVAVRMAVASRNPCERVRDYFCKKHLVDVEKCNSYQVVYKESVEDQSPKMRGVIRDQCLTKINRMKEEDGISVD